jgi:phosphoribosylaminoimidazole-succinocarboxamide synthase
MAELVGGETASKVRDVTIRLYEKGAAYALERGIILADRIRATPVRLMLS